MCFSGSLAASTLSTCFFSTSISYTQCGESSWKNREQKIASACREQYRQGFTSTRLLRSFSEASSCPRGVSSVCSGSSDSTPSWFTSTLMQPQMQQNQSESGVCRSHVVCLYDCTISPIGQDCTTLTTISYRSRSQPFPTSHSRATERANSFSVAESIEAEKSRKLSKMSLSERLSELGYKSSSSEILSGLYTLQYIIPLLMALQLYNTQDLDV